MNDKYLIMDISNPYDKGNYSYEDTQFISFNMFILDAIKSVADQTLASINLDKLKRICNCLGIQMIFSSFDSHCYGIDIEYCFCVLHIQLSIYKPTWNIVYAY